MRAILTLTLIFSLASTGVAQEPRVQAVSAGPWLTCALRTDGSVVCWGEGYRGDGTGPEDLHTEPVVGAAYCGGSSMNHSVDGGRTDHATLVRVRLPPRTDASSRRE